MIGDSGSVVDTSGILILPTLLSIILLVIVVALIVMIITISKKNKKNDQPETVSVTPENTI